MGISKMCDCFNYDLLLLFFGHKVYIEKDNEEKMTYSGILMEMQTDTREFINKLKEKYKATNIYYDKKLLECLKKPDEYLSKIRKDDLIKTFPNDKEILKLSEFIEKFIFAYKKAKKLGINILDNQLNDLLFISLKVLKS
jgi:hypothetical protein